MNIFYLDKDPKAAAINHCDKHVCKMIVEYAQLLSTAHHVLGTGTDQMYKKTHVNHPSNVWVREKYHHYEWLYECWYSLLEEYSLRYSKVHASARLVNVLRPNPLGGDLDFSDPPLCMPDHCKIHNDAVESYRNYYLTEKSKFAVWKYTPRPKWWQK